MNKCSCGLQGGQPPSGGSFGTGRSTGDGYATGSSSSSSLFASAHVLESKSKARNRKRKHSEDPKGEDSHKKKRLQDEREKASRLDGIKINQRTARMSADQYDPDAMDDSLKSIEVSGGRKIDKPKKKKKGDEEVEDPEDVGDFKQLTGDSVKRVMRQFAVKLNTGGLEDEAAGGFTFFDVPVNLIE